MRAHSANELIDVGDILGADASTVLASGVPCGVTDVEGRTSDQAQLATSRTDHMILFRTVDAAGITADSYLRVDDVLYIVDYTLDPRRPRPGTWLEVYCHVERTAN